MKVHRCPHCSKPFLESEARTGKCPVCQEVVWEIPLSDRPTTSSAGANSETESGSGSSPGPNPGSGSGSMAEPENPSPLGPAPPSPPPAPAHSLEELPAPAHARSLSLLLPTLLLASLGGVLWWVQVHNLQTQRDDLARRLSEAEGAIADAEQRAIEAEKVRQSTESSATQALTRALDKTELADRMRAALVLAKIDPHHKASQSMLLMGMQSDPVWIAPVSELEPPPQWAVPTLIGLLRDSDPNTRRLAAEALGRLRPGGPIAQAVLDTATRDRDARVRKAAELALKAIQNMNRPPSLTPN